MRVALLTNFIPPYRVTLFRALARELGELRIFVSTAMESNRSWQPEWADLDVVIQKTITIPRTWRTRDFSERLDMHLPYDTVVLLRKFRPDLIITGEMGARSVQAMAYGSATNTPVVLWATLSDRLEAHRGMLRTVIRREMVRSARAIIVNGESGARYIRQIGGTDERMITAPYTIDVDAFKGISLGKSPEHARKLLYSGGIGGRKGVPMLVQALDLWAAQHPDEGLDVTLLGHGPDFNVLAQQSVPVNVSITWAGAVPYAALPEWYARCGLFIFPSLGDEWGVVVNEAMTAGLPVIGSIYSQAVEELVQDAVNGWCFEPESPAAIAAAITRALRTPDDQLAQMRAAARETALQLHPETIAARIAEGLQKIS